MFFTAELWEGAVSGLMCFVTVALWECVVSVSGLKRFTVAVLGCLASV